MACDAACFVSELRFLREENSGTPRPRPHLGWVSEYPATFLQRRANERKDKEFHSLGVALLWIHHRQRRRLLLCLVRVDPENVCVFSTSAFLLVRTCLLPYSYFGRARPACHSSPVFNPKWKRKIRKITQTKFLLLPPALSPPPPPPRALRATELSRGRKKTINVMKIWMIECFLTCKILELQCVTCRENFKRRPHKNPNKKWTCEDSRKGSEISWWKSRRVKFKGCQPFGAFLIRGPPFSPSSALSYSFPRK